MLADEDISYNSALRTAFAKKCNANRYTNRQISRKFNFYKLYYFYIIEYASFLFISEENCKKTSRISETRIWVI